MRDASCFPSSVISKGLDFGQRLPERLRTLAEDLPGRCALARIFGVGEQDCAALADCHVGFGGVQYARPARFFAAVFPVALSSESDSDPAV